MARLLLVALVGLLVWRFLRRRDGAETVVVAWTDGSSLTVEDGAAEHDRLVATARSMIRR